MAGELHWTRLKSKEMLRKAPEIVLKITSSHFFDTHPPRRLPHFNEEELELGEVLGKGAFCTVTQISSMSLQEAAETAQSPTEEECALVENERVHLAKTCIPRGEKEGEVVPLTPRYVLKKIRTDLAKVDRAKALVDLAIEQKFLSSLQHSKIIALRGTSGPNVFDPAWGLILDRVYGTLDEKIKAWEQEFYSAAGCCCGYVGEKTEVMEELWFDRSLALLDIASALLYLHERKIIFRDLKPQNVGVDRVGTVKIFDFGMCREMTEDKRVTGEDVFMLTSYIGSWLYMAPEVALNKPYNQTADIYSYGILLWEVSALSSPFPYLTKEQIRSNVMKDGMRPDVQMGWPKYLRKLMKQCWKASYKERPQIEEVVQILRNELSHTSMKTKDQHSLSLSQRSSQLLDISKRSIQSKELIGGWDVMDTTKEE